MILIIAVGSAVVSFWVYGKYFRREEAALLFFAVERGSIQEAVKVRGEVAAGKDFDLEFPFSGTVERVFVSEGQSVGREEALAKLETRDFEIELSRLRAVALQKEANVEKLLAGPTKEDVRVSEAKVSSAKTAVEDARENLVDKLRDAYTKSDDAVRNKVDQFISGSKGANPQLNFSVSDASVEQSLESGRVAIEELLNTWKESSGALSVLSDLKEQTGVVKKNLDTIASFLNSVTFALAPLTPNTSLTQTVLDGWRADVSTARTNVNTAITNTSSAEEKLKTAESSLRVAEDELLLKKAGTRAEDVAIAEAQVKEVENQIAAVEEKIRKSTLRSPAETRVVKVWVEQREVFTPGSPAISLSGSGHKVQADISELEIGRVREGDSSEVLLRLDAFPDFEFRGKVVSIDPKEVIKDEDVFYRANVYFDSKGVNLRPGMSVDLTILVSLRENVLKVPALAVYGGGGKRFVKILDGKNQTEVEVTVGISDGESVEITSGLAEGQTVVVAAD